tara:strand:+ start:1912 stop:5058 length:3147 start_codon:yes stop_codon:yes gene_type:complete
MRFAHIADTHIRNLKYHYEYREVFNQLYDSLKKNQVDYIVHCGDIAHTKTQISPEFVELCTNFFRNLANIAPTYIILGNHDGNLKNSSRQDALTPIADAMNHPNLHLLKNSGEVVLDNNFSLNVLSVFDEDNWSTPTDLSRTNIALYHGSILSCSTDIGWVMESVDHKLDIFEPFDFAFLGDIHKTQALDSEGRIRYAGSTIQQNFGESLDKGYLLWDIENKENFTVDHVTFVSPRPFITINLTPKGRMPKKISVPPNARLRLASKTNISLDKVRRAVEIAKHRFKPESLVYLNRAANRNISAEGATDSLVQEDLRDIKVQESLIQEYLKDFQVEEDVMKKILQLNSKYNTIIEQDEEVSRNINWNLKSIEWDYLFNYGQGNKINFENLNGIVGIFGKNFSGKSSIIDSILYTIYNSTSKSIRKNLNIINQESDHGIGKVIITVGEKDYVIERSSEKYTKKLHGEQTMEAKTDLDFYNKDLLGNKTSLNGLSRTDTDKNIRRLFGTIDDFLMTSMASQLGSLSFINEGSTRRKEILAKFLDLEVFERKFRLAKEDSQETKGALKKLDGRDYIEEIRDVEVELEKSLILMDRNRARCDVLKKEIESLEFQERSLQEEIESVPAEIIDIIVTKNDLSSAESRFSVLEKNSAALRDSIRTEQEGFQKIDSFLNTFDVSSYQKKKDLIDKHKDEILKLLHESEKNSNVIVTNKRKQDLLLEVPCGTQYPSCKFIKDAHTAADLIQITEQKMSKGCIEINSLGEKVRKLEPVKVDDHLAKYDKLVEKKGYLATLLARNQVSLEKNKTQIIKTSVEIEKLEEKIAEYENNREVIENLEQLLSTRERVLDEREEKKIEHERCREEIHTLYRQHGSLEHQLETLKEQKEMISELSLEYAAYDLLMACCHSNGISYDIIKKRLPLINSEIAKTLTNIVDFDIFIENDGNKLDISIKHPKHEPRPLELGSGAEKTIASMAIRLAFLSVSSLPKPDIFILDEPGTALDEENMEGFIRILDMVKSYFKTVILISHLDSLKDCVDSQIIIEKNNGFAQVDV